jgi:hypothetical protein
MPHERCARHAVSNWRCALAMKPFKTNGLGAYLSVATIAVAVIVSFFAVAYFLLFLP